MHEENFKIIKSLMGLRYYYDPDEFHHMETRVPDEIILDAIEIITFYPSTKWKYELPVRENFVEGKAYYDNRYLRLIGKNDYFNLTIELNGNWTATLKFKNEEEILIKAEYNKHLIWYIQFHINEYKKNHERI